MKKYKKITIKPFLNDKLAPAECSDSDGKDHYPLYIQITYDRKNTQIRSKYGNYYENLKDPELKNLVELESKILRKIIEYETKDNDKPYDLKGLKERYDVFSNSIHVVFSEFLKEKLRKTIMKTKINEFMFVLNFKRTVGDFDNLYKAAKKLFSNLPQVMTAEFKQEINAFDLLNKLHPIINGTYSFPTLIEWKDNSFKSVFEISLSGELKNNKKAISDTVKIIDEIINDRLKNVVVTK